MYLLYIVVSQNRTCFIMFIVKLLHCSQLLKEGEILQKKSWMKESEKSRREMPNWNKDRKRLNERNYYMANFWNTDKTVLNSAWLLCGTPAQSTDLPHTFWLIVELWGHCCLKIIESSNFYAHLSGY